MFRSGKQRKHDGLDGTLEQSVVYGLSVHTELVMFPLFLVGRALQHFRAVRSEVKESVYELKREFERHYNSPFQRLQEKNLLEKDLKSPMNRWRNITKIFLAHANIGA